MSDLPIRVKLTPTRRLEECTATGHKTPFHCPRHEHGRKAQVCCYPAISRGRIHVPRKVIRRWRAVRRQKSSAFSDLGRRVKSSWARVCHGHVLTGRRTTAMVSYVGKM